MKFGKGNFENELRIAKNKVRKTRFGIREDLENEIRIMKLGIRSLEMEIWKTNIIEKQNA